MQLDSRWRLLGTCLVMLAIAIIAVGRPLPRRCRGRDVPPASDAVAGTPLTQTSPAVASDCNGPPSPPHRRQYHQCGFGFLSSSCRRSGAPNFMERQTIGGSDQAVLQRKLPDSQIRSTCLHCPWRPMDPPASQRSATGRVPTGRSSAAQRSSIAASPRFPSRSATFAKYPYLVKMSYSLGAIAPSQYWHLTFDLWLEQTVSKGPRASDVEVLISPYSSYPACGTAKPAFTASGDTWSVYEGCGATKATTLASP